MLAQQVREDSHAPERGSMGVLIEAVPVQPEKPVPRALASIAPARRDPVSGDSKDGHDEPARSGGPLFPWAKAGDGLEASRTPA